MKMIRLCSFEQSACKRNETKGTTHTHTHTRTESEAALKKDEMLGNLYLFRSLECLPGFLILFQEKLKVLHVVALGVVQLLHDSGSNLLSSS